MDPDYTDPEFAHEVYNLYWFVLAQAQHESRWECVRPREKRLLDPLLADLRAGGPGYFLNQVVSGKPIPPVDERPEDIRMKFTSQIQALKRSSLEILHRHLKELEKEILRLQVLAYREAEDSGELAREFKREGIPGPTSVRVAEA